MRHFGKFIVVLAIAMLNTNYTDSIANPLSPEGELTLDEEPLEGGKDGLANDANKSAKARKATTDPVLVQKISPKKEKAKSAIPRSLPGAIPEETSAEQKFKLSGELTVRSLRTLETSGAQTEGTTENLLNRVRVRLELKALVNEKISAKIKFSTGGVGTGSTRTSFQTLNASTENKQFDINWAYVDYTASKNLGVWAGRTPNPFWAAGGYDVLFASGDLAFDGLSSQLKYDFGGVKPFFNFTYANMLERVNNGGNASASPTIGPDIYLLGAQLGSLFRGSFLELTASASSLAYNNIQNLSTSSGLCSSTSSCYGNSIQSLAFKYDYNLTGASVQLGTRSERMPISLISQYAFNSNLEKENRVSTLGLTVGKLGAVGSFFFRTIYADIQKDSLLGILTEAASGSDAINMSYELNVQALKDSTLGFTYISSRRNVSEKNYMQELYMLDWKSKF